jgi:hypothetical protein
MSRPMKRLGRDSTRYLEQFNVLTGPETALISAIVNQAIIDHITPPRDKASLKYMGEIYPAKKFLKEWNIIK